MGILVTGAEGMLGRTIMNRLSDHDLTGIDVDDCDITDAEKTIELVSRLNPDTIIHCAAMTAVDKCEEEKDTAFAVNAIGSANIASSAAKVGARLIAISTDYVFNGSQERPYHEWDAPCPESVYGTSKLAGEEAIRHHCPDHLICRIAWLYGAGGPSFLHTMLRLGREGGAALKVVNDQIGNPTSCAAVADHLRLLLSKPVCGTMHLTCEGEASWYDFTCEIFRLQNITREVMPCTTDQFPRPAPRPANSRLEKRALRLHGLPPMPHWQEALAQFLKENPDG